MSDNKYKNAKYFDEQKWNEVNKKNKEIMEEFLDNKKDLSDKSIEQYLNALQIFFLWVLENSDNSFIVDLKKRDILKYQNWLIKQKLSPNGVKFKRSAISSLCNFIETYYDDKYPTFRNIVKGVEAPQGDKRYKKEPLTLEELEKLRVYLTENEKWQQLAFLEIAYSTGARRAEIRQLRKEIVDYKPNEKGFYTTHDVRCKGRTNTGRVRKLFFSEQARLAIIKWLEIRGEDECEFIFVSKTKDGEVNQLNEGGFNYWCNKTWNKVIGRRVHPHLVRSTRATHLVTVENKDINSAKNLLGHNSSQTTEIYVVRDEKESLEECF